MFDRELPSQWTLTSVDAIKANEKSACVAGPFGSNISSKYFVAEGVPVIRGSNLTDDLTRFVPESFVFVSLDRAAAYRAQHVRAGDLVFTCWGTIGQVGLIPADGPFPEYIISNKQLKLRPDAAVADPLYLFYYFASPQMVAHIRNRAIGAAVPGINLGILKALEVVLPPPRDQRRIASILSAYDDLIENNTRRIAILEEMARRIHEEWFVRFRFPGYENVRMVESELGLVPEEWDFTTLGAVCAYINRGLAPKYDEDAPGLVINQKCIRNQRLSLSEARRQSKAVPKDKLVLVGDVLINSTGVGTLGRVAQVMEPLESCTVDTHVSIVRPSRDMDHDFFGSALLSKQPHFEAQGVGSTGQTELSRGRIAETAILLPPKPLRDQFGKLVKPMRQLAVRLQVKNANLRATRDLLLPKLISGELDVSALPEPEAIAA
ncbi:restriction endonuclease subunit S [Panacagrimonas perspica]|uniref:restriction endonuclease subunit S n=1 Tax=Panacagrimonas perspica TaxID=381431 RepID=UPI001B396A6C|nr:restriction endonuclease subunit S [Panacagrimonas perspica]